MLIFVGEYSLKKTRGVLVWLEVVWVVFNDPWYLGQSKAFDFSTHTLAPICWSIRGLAPAHISLAFLLRPPFPQDNTSSFIRDPLDLDPCRFLPMLIFHQSFDYLEDRSYS